MDRRLKKSLAEVAAFYDARKVGDVGPLGFRRSSDMATLLACVDRLVSEGLLEPGVTTFLDLGCGDGRVNLLFSFLVRRSVGIEIDEWTLDEYDDTLPILRKRLGDSGLPTPPDNISLFCGDSTDERIHQDIFKQTGLAIDRFDLFYTYLIMHHEFAALLNEKARKGAVFMVYGLQKILPHYDGFRHLDGLSPMEGILALYQKL